MLSANWWLFCLGLNVLIKRKLVCKFNITENALSLILFQFLHMYVSSTHLLPFSNSVCRVVIHGIGVSGDTIEVSFLEFDTVILKNTIVMHLIPFEGHIHVFCGKIAIPLAENTKKTPTISIRANGVAAADLNWRSVNMGLFK